MKDASVNTSITKSETQIAVLNWMQATQQFHQYYLKLNDVLRKSIVKRKACTSTDGSANGQIRNLINLRQHMNVVLETLLVDIDKPSMSPFNNTHLANLSKTGQLITHTRLIVDLNRKISRELSSIMTVKA